MNKTYPFSSECSDCVSLDMAGDHFCKTCVFHNESPDSTDNRMIATDYKGPPLIETALVKSTEKNTAIENASRSGVLSFGVDPIKPPALLVQLKNKCTVTDQRRNVKIVNEPITIPNNMRKKIGKLLGINVLLVQLFTIIATVMLFVKFIMINATLATITAKTIAVIVVFIIALYAGVRSFFESR